MSLDIEYDPSTHVLSINLEPTAEQFDLPDSYDFNRVVNGIVERLKTIEDSVTIELFPLRGADGVIPFVDGDRLILDLLSALVEQKTTEKHPKIKRVMVWQVDIEQYLHDFADALLAFCHGTGIEIDFYDTANEVDFSFSPTATDQKDASASQEASTLSLPGFGFNRA